MTRNRAGNAPGTSLCSPLVPPEWVEAHGFALAWLRPGRAAPGRRGVCPFAAAVLDAVAAGEAAGPVVLATTCDQMRYVAGALEHRGAPVFLLNVPSTWQTATARAMYADELARLGRHLERLGGRPPGPGELARAMVRFDRARSRLLEQRGELSAGELARALIAVRTGSWPENASGPAQAPGVAPPGRGRNAASQRPPRGIALALAGGPALDEDLQLVARMERAGGRFVLDAGEWGERTLPRPFDGARLDASPFDELVDAYLGSIPSVFQRPDDPFHDDLEQEIAARGVRGVVVLRRPWCDLWHARIVRLRESAGVPVLDLDLDGSGGLEAASGRVEAFLESLDPRK